uniref:hypothetical protein n=1 Tax=Micromonospora echinaurantiaca TaxID=47857 RepID=UPI001E5F347B|nr:hypothetical protein [Micromonospora echinaurantiaca]
MLSPRCSTLSGIDSGLPPRSQAKCSLVAESMVTWLGTDSAGRLDLLLRATTCVRSVLALER